MITTYIAIWGALLSTFQEVRRSLDKHIARRRRKLHNFVLEAMGVQAGSLAPRIDGVRFDLASIDRKLQISQRHQLLGTNPANEELEGEVCLIPIPDGTKAGKVREKKIRKKQAQMGLPRLEDPHREQSLENILDDMVETGRLHRHAPRTWSIS